MLTRIFEILIIIGVFLIAYSVIFLKTPYTIMVKNYNDAFLPSNTYIAVPLYLGTNDELNIRSNITFPKNFTIFLSISNTYYPDNIMDNLTSFVGKNYTFRNNPGKYYLLFVNNSPRNISFRYYIIIYKHRFREAYHGLVSLSGVSILLIGVLSLFYLKMRELTEKYPDHVFSKNIECWSTKINKHKCKILVPVSTPEIFNIVNNVLAEEKYRVREKLSDIVYAYEKKVGLLERFHNKPVELLVAIEEPYLTLYYTVWGITASGSKDLTWILREAEKIRDRIYSVYGVKDINGDDEESRVTG